MKIKKFIHDDVMKNGKCKSGGAIFTEGKVILIKGSCDLPNCNCSQGFFLIVTMPLKGKVVEGIQVEFKDLKEMVETLGIFQKTQKAKEEKKC